MTRTVLVCLVLASVGCAGRVASGADDGGRDGTDTGSAQSDGWDAWHETGTAALPQCVVSAGTKQYDLYGDDGYAPSALPAGACSVDLACAVLIATGPYCGDETVSENYYLCECVRSRWDCVGEAQSGGVALRGWCDGGDGTNDGG
jgi:hypothetical protein